MINFPTRFDPDNDRSACLDYIITNDTTFVNNISSYGPIANCDHIPISFQINSRIPNAKNFTTHVWNFKRGDFGKLNRKLAEYPWDTIFIIDDLDTIVDTWTDIFLELAKECIPYTKITVRPSDLPYQNQELKLKIRNKDRAFKRWLRTRRDNHRVFYTNVRNDTTTALRNARNT